MAATQPIRNIQSEQNFGQVERARTERQLKQEKITQAKAANSNDATRNANVVRFGEVGTRVNTTRQTTTATQQAHPDTATSFNKSYDQAGLQPANLNRAPNDTSITQRTSNQTRATKVQYLEPGVTERPTIIPVVRKKKKKPNTALREVARLRATGINAWVMASSATLFIPLAVFSISSVIFLGIAFFAEWLQDPNNASNIATSNPNNSSSPLVQVAIAGVVRVASTFSQAVAAILKYFTGIDILELPMQLFTITYLVSLGIGVFILLTMYLLYTFSFIKSLSGERAGLKQIAFIIALVGHSIPLMNIFPWFMIWATAVWFYPK